ncbi:MAG TPA: hypothetical protein VJT73_16590 [Polyangiaceae bacterium]|nr:hypothetical protein [Polyangiaceae bacterium]
MNRTKRRSFNGWSTALAIGLASLGTPAFAQTSAPSNPSSDEANRLLQSRNSEGYTVAVPGVSVPAGGAMIAVDAPLPVVRQIVTDYAHYQDFVPGFQKSRIVGNGDRGTDVYLQAPILHGSANLWAVARFSPPVPDGPGERIEGRKAGQGNVDDFRATWRLYAVDDSHTILKIEVLMVPSLLPLPTSVVTPHLVSSSAAAVRACRDRAESRNNLWGGGPRSD